MSGPDKADIVPFVVKLRPSQWLRIEVEGADGSFDVKYNLRGDGRLTVTCEIDGTSLGGAEELYTETVATPYIDEDPVLEDF